MPARFMPLEVERFREYLKDEQEKILGSVRSDFGRQIINLTFEILDVDLRVEFEDADKEFSTAGGSEGFGGQR